MGSDTGKGVKILYFGAKISKSFQCRIFSMLDIIRQEEFIKREMEMGQF